jgi:hypothetical protein
MDIKVYNLFCEAETKEKKEALCYWYLSDIKDWLQLYSDNLIKDDEIYDTFVATWSKCGGDIAGVVSTASIDMQETEVGYNDKTGNTMWDIIKAHRPRLPKKIKKTGMTIYRACNRAELEDNYYGSMGASWSTDIDVARRFLQSNFDGVVVKYTAVDETICAYTDNRGEKEYICPYIDQSDCEILEEALNKNPNEMVMTYLLANEIA